MVGPTQPLACSPGILALSLLGLSQTAIQCPCLLKLLVGGAGGALCGFPARVWTGGGGLALCVGAEPLAGSLLGKHSDGYVPEVYEGMLSTVFDIRLYLELFSGP